MLKRYDGPAARQNPYPDGPAKITDFRYDTALVLLRLRDAPRMRNGEDADYIVGRTYQVSWRDADQVWHPLVTPPGLLTDLTSVPRLFRFLVGRVGPWLEAAIVHDYLYIAWQDIDGRGARDADRRFADDLMLAAMNAARVALWRRWAIFAALRVFGGAGYRRRSRQRFVDVTDAQIMDQIPPLPPARR
ncbi:DUF1353 domain-containing protein [Yoonia sp. 2307UL14-13]